MPNGRSSGPESSCYTILQLPVENELPLCLALLPARRQVARAPSDCAARRTEAASKQKAAQYWRCACIWPPDPAGWLAGQVAGFLRLEALCSRPFGYQRCRFRWRRATSTSAFGLLLLSANYIVVEHKHTMAAKSISLLYWTPTVGQPAF